MKSGLEVKTHQIFSFAQNLKKQNLCVHLEISNKFFSFKLKCNLIDAINLIGLF